MRTGNALRNRRILWNETTVAYVKVSAQNLTVQTEDIDEKSQPVGNSRGTAIQYIGLEAGKFTTEPTEIFNSL